MEFKKGILWGGKFGRPPTVELPTPGANQGKIIDYIQEEHRIFFEVGYFADGLWCSFERAFDHEEALEKQARLAYSHQRDLAIVQVDIKITRKFV